MILTLKSISDFVLILIDIDLRLCFGEIELTILIHY